MSKDKEAETDYSSQGEIRFITSPVRNTPISNRPRSPPSSSRPPFYVPEQTSLELENEADLADALKDQELSALSKL